MGLVKVLDARTLVQIAGFSAMIPSPASGVSSIARKGVPVGNWVEGTGTGMDDDDYSVASSSRGSSRVSGGVNRSRPSSAAPTIRAGGVARVRPSSATAKPTPSGQTVAPSGSPGVSDVTGLVVVRGLATSASSQLQSLYVIASNAAGCAVKISIGSLQALSSSASCRTLPTRPRSASSGNAAASDARLLPTPVTALFHYHVGSVWGLSTERSTVIGGPIVGTVGDDRALCVWNAGDHAFLGRRILAAAGRCCHFDKYCNFVIVGMVDGGISLFSLDFDSNLALTFKEVCFRKDCKSEISEVRFSPSNSKLAVGSHDNVILVYSCSLLPPSSTDSQPQRERGSSRQNSTNLQRLFELKGHSASITHLGTNAISVGVKS